MIGWLDRWLKRECGGGVLVACHVGASWAVAIARRGRGAEGVSILARQRAHAGRVGAGRAGGWGSDGAVWGTEGAAAVPAPNEHNLRSFDVLYVVTNSNNPQGQLAVAEAVPGNPDYNSGRCGPSSASRRLGHPKTGPSQQYLSGVH